MLLFAIRDEFFLSIPIYRTHHNLATVPAAQQSSLQPTGMIVPGWISKLVCLFPVLSSNTKQVSRSGLPLAASGPSADGRCASLRGRNAPAK